MDFTEPAGPNPIDRQKVIGKPHDRIDGPRKVAGKATYAYEYHDEVRNAAYGYLVTSGVGKGVIEVLETGDAERAPGVLLVMTYKNAPKQGAGKNAVPQLQGPAIRQFGQSVAFVVAETFEDARAAASMIRIGYAQQSGRFSLDADKTLAKPEGQDAIKGDFDSAFAAARYKVDATYTTPDQSHAMMEPHASVAAWDGDRVIIRLAHQMLPRARTAIAETLGVQQDQVQLISAFIGGGFGSKLVVYADPIVAALAARTLGRPVKVALTRPQIFNHTTHRAATIQRIRLAADEDGKLIAIGHETITGDQPGGKGEQASGQTKLLYAGPNRLIQARLVELDLPKAGAMRAPGEAAGLLALENAMDELADTLGIDPVELRIVNDTQYDPHAGPGRPFADRKLVECLRTGAERFGWSKRNPKAGQVRDGRWLVGMGVAAGIRSAPVLPSGTRATLRADGTLLIETAMTDPGTGSYTINGQTGAEMLGLPLERVEVRLGDTAFPDAPGSGGSFGAASSTSGTYAGCAALRAKLAWLAGIDPTIAVFENGMIAGDGKTVALKSLASSGPIVAEDSMSYGDLETRYAQASFAAHFAEVGIDSYTGEPRVRRMLSVCSIGRVLNPKTARSQCLGGMTMGIGAALMEELVVDPRFGYFVNHDLAEYQVPVHLDIPDLDVVFLDGEDNKASIMKARGVGELGICGVGAAVTNAIYNACGVRIRDYPAQMDKIVDKLASVVAT
jgi:xanthine dehydrogenase YagR molybdenum-binding subunit